MPLSSTFGTRMRLARESRGYTREAFAKLIHVTPQTVYNYEKSKKGVDLDLLERIAHALEVSPLDLLGEGELPPRREPTAAEAIEVIRKLVESAEAPKSNSIPTLPAPIFDLLKRMEPEDEARVTAAIRVALGIAPDANEEEPAVQDVSDRTTLDRFIYVHDHGDRRELSTLMLMLENKARRKRSSGEGGASAAEQA